MARRAEPPIGTVMRSDFSRARRSGMQAATFAIPLALGACQRAVLNPAGDIALQERNLIYAATGLMLLIIVPVMLLIMLFAWRYRAGNRDATYDPSFSHSASLELVIWSVPLLIIIALGALTWSSTHLLDPFRPIDRVAGRAVDSKAQPLRIQVVALDWKWLFIYPEQGIATVNELALPVNRPVRFDITSTNMMNSFYAPTLAGMIYAMPGMQSSMNAVLNRAGDSEGFSANYSGAGFSDMRFKLRGLDQPGFDRWVSDAKASGHALAIADYLALERPSEKVAAMRFAKVQPGLFDRIVNRCARPGTPCMRDVMSHDQRANGGNPDPMSGVAMPSGRNVPPANGAKPKGALFKNPGEMIPAPNVTRPRQPGAPGNAEPSSPGNRDMTYLILPTAPALVATLQA